MELRPVYELSKENNKTKSAASTLMWSLSPPRKVTV